MAIGIYAYKSMRFMVMTWAASILVFLSVIVRLIGAEGKTFDTSNKFVGKADDR